MQIKWKRDVSLAVLTAAARARAGIAFSISFHCKTNLPERPTFRLTKVSSLRPRPSAFGAGLL